MIPPFPHRVRTLTAFHRTLLALAMPMLLLAAWAMFTKFWQNSTTLLVSGDVVRFWLNRVAAVVSCLGCLAMDVVLLSLLLKRVIVTEEGVVFTGLFRRSLRWADVKDARIVAERYTTSLQLRSVTDKRYEIGIGDQNAADVCREVMAVILRIRGTLNEQPNHAPTPAPSTAPAAPESPQP
jgi:hypothetical protein